MNVAEFAAAELGDPASIMIDPALVHQVVNLASISGLQLDLAEGTGVPHVGRRAGGDLQNQGLTSLVIEQLAYADAVI